MIRILVTGVGGAPGANFVASLRLIKKEKIFIIGTDTNKYHLELVAGVDRKYLLPSCDDPDYLTKLNNIIKKEKVQFLHCQPEQEVWFAAKHRDHLKTKTLLPSSDVLDITFHKLKLHQLLEKNNIHTPKSIGLRSKSDLGPALKALKGPLGKVWLRATVGAGSKASLPVSNVLQAEGWIDYWKTHRGLGYKDFAVSEFLPGKEFAFQSIWYKGKLITSMARERVEYLFGHLFPSGQSSSPSIAKTVHREDINEVATKSIRVLDSKATGIFCVDLKENVLEQPCVTEINAGRFFTTSNNFSVAGLNMPYYYVLLGLGRKIPHLPQYNGIPAGWYWIRMMDMGYTLVKGELWNNISL